MHLHLLGNIPICPDPRTRLEGKIKGTGVCTCGEHWDSGIVFAELCVFVWGNGNRMISVSVAYMARWATQQIHFFKLFSISLYFEVRLQR